MKRHILAILAGSCGAAMIAAPAQAVYLGLQTTYDIVNVGGVLRNVYRVYAMFSDPNDYLNGVIAGPQYGPISIQSRNESGTGPGSNFFNPVFSHPTAPTPVEVFGGIDFSGNPIPPVPNAAYDTFLTVGLHAGQAGTGINGQDQTSSAFVPADFINGTSLTVDEGGWFVPGAVEQGRAGWPGDGDPLLRVLMMQLTVSSTSFVIGTVNVLVIEGGQTSLVYLNQGFGPLIPGPGTIGIVGLIGIAAWPRRRRG